MKITKPDRMVRPCACQIAGRVWHLKHAKQLDLRTTPPKLAVKSVSFVLSKGGGPRNHPGHRNCQWLELTGAWLRNCSRRSPCTLTVPRDDHRLVPKNLIRIIRSLVQGVAPHHSRTVHSQNLNTSVSVAQKRVEICIDGHVDRVRLRKCWIDLSPR